jgi:hydroxymethylglutaryl-CoA lyase
VSAHRQDPAHDRGGGPSSSGREARGHYHDTFGQALANIFASLEMGMATFDSSAPVSAVAPTRPARPQCGHRGRGLHAGRTGIETGVDMTRC